MIEVEKLVDWLHLPQRGRSWCVCGGAMLQKLSIRDANNLDILVNDALYRRLARNHEQWQVKYRADVSYLSNRVARRIQIHLANDTDAYLTRSKRINNVPYILLSDACEHKARTRRRFDLQDLRLVKTWLEASRHTSLLVTQPSALHTKIVNWVQQPQQQIREIPESDGPIRYDENEHCLDCVLNRNHRSEQPMERVAASDGSEGAYDPSERRSLGESIGLRVWSIGTLTG
jgi:hypothetical protein